MIPAEAARIADQIKARRSPEGRQWPRSELDRYEKELLMLKAEGLTNTELVGWLRRQKPRVITTATRLKFWFKRKAKETDEGAEGAGVAAPIAPQTPSDVDAQAAAVPVEEVDPDTIDVPKGKGKRVRMSKEA